MAKLKYGFDERSLRWWLSTHEDVIFARNGVSHILLYTSKSIQSGEQIFYDYGPDYWKKRKPPR